jgi:thioredoxin 1
MAIIEVDEDNFKEEIESAFEQKKHVILKFGSEYCEPCHALEGELEDLDEEVENLAILMVDTDESPELAERYDVFALPTMVIYDVNQTIIYNKEGIILAYDIEKIINSKEK